MDDILNFSYYKKKPITVRAIQLTEDLWNKLNSINDRLIQVNGRVIFACSDSSINKWFIIETLEGMMKAELNDMLILGVKGELYPCKLDIFNETYDKEV